MSSYTDATLQFSPYVSQMPLIQERSIVGREKQAQYEEGVQRIQSSIDNVAGLDVVRDVDKQYLQSKLDELGNNLKTVAAGDFSNFQLVNSVGGMVNQIAKDPTVINAVSSTNWYKKQLGEIETARKEGKSSVQNEWDFQTRAQNWFQSNDVNTKFSDYYTPYTDVDKKFFEVLKNLHSDLTEQDIPYETNIDGTINYNKTAAAMQRKSKEVVSRERLEAALKASLSPTEINQLGINGRFQFKDFDGTGMANYFKSTYGSSIKNNTAQINKYKEVAKTLANGKEKDAILSNIAMLENENTKLSQEMQSEIDFAISSPEQAKEYIYKNEAIRQFADAYSWEHNKVNEIANVRLEAEHWEKENALKRAQFNLETDKFSWNKVKDNFDMQMALKEYEAKYGMTEVPFDSYGGANTSGLVKSPIAKAENKLFTLESEANKEVQELAKAINTNVGVVESTLQKLANGDKDAPISQEFKEAFDNILTKRADAKAIRQSIEDTRNQVKNSEKYIAKNKEIAAKIQELPDVNIEGVYFSREELLDYASKLPESLTYGGAWPTGKAAEERGKTLFSVPNPTQKQKILMDSFGGNRDLRLVINKYRAVYKDNLSNLVDEIEKDVQLEYGKKNITYLPRQVALPMEKPEQVARWTSIAASAINSYKGGRVSGMKGGTETMSKEDVEKAETWLGKEAKGNIIFGKVEQGGDTFLQLQKVDSNEEVLIPLTYEQSTKLPFVDKGTASLEDIRLEERLAAGNYKTNPSDNFSDSFYLSNRFPRVSRLNVRADVSRNFTNPNKKYLTLRLMVDGKQYSLDLERPSTREQIEQTMGQMNDDIIKGLFLESPKISNEAKEAIKKL